MADLGALNPGLDAALALAFAVLNEGVLYMDPINTPFGAHPYPQILRAGVWSSSKSPIPGLAVLHLTQKYGPDFLDTKVVSYFKESDKFAYIDDAARARWGMVRDALNMMTGMGATGYGPH